MRFAILISAVMLYLCCGQNYTLVPASSIVQEQDIFSDALMRGSPHRELSTTCSGATTCSQCLLSSDGCEFNEIDDLYSCESANSSG